MGRDKAALDYHGQPQVRWAYALVSRHCARTFVSLRPDQQDDPARAGLPTIADLHERLGPIAGIAAAQAAHPQAAWLVVACDLPFLTDGTLSLLVSRRGHGDVTAFRSAHDGLPEPLCAIYEPQTRAAILAAIAGGRHCPRKFLIAAGYPLLELPEASLLDNVNTPQEHETALSVLHGRSGGTAA
jgi:molybdopterin-guanine dinucleotide biosynthesis protein A